MDKKYDLCQLEITPEYAALKALENSINEGMNYRKFAESISYMHPTLQQTLFKLMRECVVFMAEKGNVHIDNRNRNAFSVCQQIAPYLKNMYLPLI